MNNFIGTVVRFVVSAIVLLVVGYLVPGFGRLTFFSAILAAIVIAALGWVIERLFGREVSPFGRGISGFIASAVVIYIAQWFVPGMRVTILGALLASLVIGVIDLFVPGNVLRSEPAGERNRERADDRR
ncbi:phage holin family protein [Effusibacillus pohliae]|uniref:phage holin family protein n=1 Tax=Effusibacillus pohliae TaxID=232270 RepID=UPI00037AFA16|nr:phage holin family protein [Effusibacillus pohliae]